MYNRNEKNNWTLFLFILAGIVVGSFIGYYVGGLPYMQWLNAGQDFAINPPVSLKLGIIELMIGFTFRFNLSGVIGIALAIFIYQRLK